MDYTIENANKWIKEKQHTINDYYRGVFHMQPPIGWMNDPNGLVYFKDNFHLYYQFYPYDASTGAMHWGQFISSDLISYTDESVALAPTNQDMETGCFSGSSIVVGDKNYIVYTNHFERDGIKKENQYMLFSNDGVIYQKINHPVVDVSCLPPNISKEDFRDPAVYKINDSYYMFIGGKLIKENKGILLVFKSTNLEKFEFDFYFGPIKEFGDMLECPDYLKIDNKDIFIFSACNLPQEENSYHNVNSSLYMVGKLDLENKTYVIESIRELDKGDAFYAPKMIANYDKHIMIAWMEMWGKDIPTIKWGHKWSGSFTFPRELSLKDNTIYQWPIDNIKNYYKETKILCHQDVISRHADITLKCKNDFILKFLNPNNDDLYVEIGKKNNHIYLDTTHSNNMNGFVRLNDDIIESNFEIRILLDSSSIEIFINKGKETISSRIYLESKEYAVNLLGEGIETQINFIERGK